MLRDVDFRFVCFQTYCRLTGHGDGDACVNMGLGVGVSRCAMHDRDVEGHDNGVG